MPLLRLAYSTQFLIALIAVFVLWSQVGGQSHLDLMPWYLKLGLGAGAAFATVKATAAAVSQDRAWGGPTLKWFGIVLALLVGCGMASYYYHVYGESDDTDQQDSQTSSRLGQSIHSPPITPVCLYFRLDAFAFSRSATSFARNLAMRPINLTGTGSEIGKRIVPF
jgi:hypothetical protein